MYILLSTLFLSSSQAMGVASNDDRSILKREIKVLKPYADKQKKLLEKQRKDEKKQAKKKKKWNSHLPLTYSDQKFYMQYLQAI